MSAPPEWFVEMIEAEESTQEKWDYFYDIVVNSKVHDSVFLVQQRIDEGVWDVCCIFHSEKAAHTEVDERRKVEKAFPPDFDVEWRVQPWGIKDTERAWDLPTSG